jgi:tetratricopeptide (TPR) repeat protein
MDRCLEDFHKVFIKIRDRTKELQCNFDIQVFNIPVVQINDLAKKALGSKNERLKKELAEFHMMKMYDFYTAMKDKNNALIHGELSFLFDQVPADTQSSNNLGYLFLSKGNLQKARALFENALTKTNPLLEDTKIGIYSE